AEQLVDEAEVGIEDQPPHHADGHGGGYKREQDGHADPFFAAERAPQQQRNAHAEDHFADQGDAGEAQRAADGGPEAFDVGQDREVVLQADKLGRGADRTLRVGEAEVQGPGQREDDQDAYEDHRGGGEEPLAVPVGPGGEVLAGA